MIVTIHITSGRHTALRLLPCWKVVVVIYKVARAHLPPLLQYQEHLIPDFSYLSVSFALDWDGICLSTDGHTSNTSGRCIYRELTWRITEPDTARLWGIKRRAVSSFVPKVAPHTLIFFLWRPRPHTFACSGAPGSRPRTCPPTPTRRLMQILTRYLILR